MTGEITLHGKVLPIGGLREKTMAAYKAGISCVLIPDDNRQDYERLDDYIKNGMKFVFCKTVDDVLRISLVRLPFDKENTANGNLFAEGQYIDAVDRLKKRNVINDSEFCKNQP